MNNTIAEELTSQIKDYFLNLADDVFPNELKSKATVFLSGSTGWGIAEGFDNVADWDLHIIMEDDDYNGFVEKLGADYVIDDHEHKPIVFAQIRSRKWLMNRINKLYEGDCLYTWIYSNGLFVLDPLNINELINGYRKILSDNLPEFVRYHFVTFSVRRLDAASSAKRGLDVGARISNAEMAKAALQTLSLLYKKPYPYNKWLAKHISMLGEDGANCLDLVTKSLNSPTLEDLVLNAKLLRNFMEQIAEKFYGKQTWIYEWWKFNQNPPEMNLK